jgi:hypothetical protein
MFQFCQRHVNRVLTYALQNVDEVGVDVDSAACRGRATNAGP